MYWFQAHLLLILLVTIVSSLSTPPKFPLSYVECKNPGEWAALEAYWKNLSRTDCTEWWKGHSNLTTIYGASLGWDRNHTSSSLNSLRLERLVDRMWRAPEEPVHIFVFGGSMTAGRNVKGHEGAWPNEVMKMWNGQDKVKQKLLAPIAVSNLAVPATTSYWLLSRVSHFFPSTTRCDIVIFDYDINDSAYWHDDDDDRQDMVATLEVLFFRVLTQMPQNPVVVYFNSVTSYRSGDHITPFCCEYRTHWQLGEVKNVVAADYDLRVVSTKLGVWTNWTCPPHRGFMDCKGAGCAHPSWYAHQFYADLVVNLLRITVGLNASPQPPPPKAVEEAALAALKRRPFVFDLSKAVNHASCPLLLTWVDVDNAEAIVEQFQSSSSSSLSGGLWSGGRGSGNGSALVGMDSPCWRHRHDWAGKDKGFVAEGSNCFGASLYFRVVFGSFPILTISHLNTYNRTGGIARVDISTPLSLNHSLTDKDFTKIGFFDTFQLVGDEGSSSSIISPTVYTAENHKALVANATQVVKIVLVDANTAPAQQTRDSSERYNPRNSPQKVKISGLASC